MKSPLCVRLLCLAMFLLSWSVLHAQPDMHIRSVDTIRTPGGMELALFFSATCNGRPAMNLSASDLRLFEDGLEVSSFTVDCPDSVNPISAVMVFDASGSMSGSGNAGAKAAGRAFVDAMNAPPDEAAVLWFNSNVIVMQSMTTLKPLLYSAIDAIPASGSTAVWDATYTGVEELVRDGQRPCRAVIVLTDGADNASTRIPSEIIHLAQRENVRVFTVQLGATANTPQLDSIASLTGGRFYQTPNAGQLAAIYQDISTQVRACFHECVLRVTRPCGDGRQHRLRLVLENVCGGSAQDSILYTAPLDSAQFTALQMALGRTHVRAGTSLRVPLTLQTSMSGEYFEPFRFRLAYDPAVLTLVDVSAPAGSLLEGLSLDVRTIGSGLVEIATRDRKAVSGSGLLAELQFLAAVREDTSCTALTASVASFDAGCALPSIASGEVCVHPASLSGPLISCDVFAPGRLHWDAALNSYVPNPFTVSARFYNTGEAAAEGARYVVSYDPTVLRRLSPASDTITLLPPVIARDAFAPVSWTFSAQMRDEEDTARVCITARFENSPDLECCAAIILPTAEPMLSCSLSAPRITVDLPNGAYTPMPFLLDVAVTNTGGMRARTITGTLSVDSGLVLAGDDAPDRWIKPLQPVFLDPGESGRLTWLLSHAVSTEEVQRGVRVVIRSQDADPDSCSITVTIPGITPEFRIGIAAGGPLDFCAGGEVTLDAGAGYDTYLWNRGDTTRTIVVTQSGSYFCTVRAGTRIGTSDTVTVTVLPPPSKPVINRSGDVLTTGVAAAWQWYRDGQPVSGETNQYLVLTETGSYTVVVTDTNGCTAESDPFDVTVLDISALPPSVRAFHVYPNPAGPSVQVSVALETPAPLRCMVTDMLGRVLRAWDLPAGREVRTRVDLSGLPAGPYLLRVGFGTQQLQKLILRR